MKLEVGDRIYQTNYSRITRIYTIERVTNTLAICKDEKFKREYIDGYSITKVNSGTWGTSYCYVETPKLKEQLLRQNILDKLRTFKYDSVSTEKLRAIMNILIDK